MTERQLLRTAPHYWTRTRVDRKNLQLYDVVAMQANVEALGHNCMTDLKSVQMVEQLANQHRGGRGSGTVRASRHERECRRAQGDAEQELPCSRR